MRAAIRIVGMVLLIAIIGGLGFVWIQRTRHAAASAQCQMNLKQIGLAIHGYHDTYKHCPVGTCKASHLPPEKRLSWLPAILPYVESAGLLLLDPSKTWDCAENNPVRRRERDSGQRKPIGELIVGEISVFICPANSQRLGQDYPCAIHYVGIAGLGNDAATLPLDHENAGFFGYERKLKLTDIARGTENTLALLEVSEGGPWTAGGSSTVKALQPGVLPYFGADGQFGGRHPLTAHGLFADGSVRTIPFDAASASLESMVTLGRKEPTESALRFHFVRPPSLFILSPLAPLIR
jgi:prepilin-type processing-associated H-X9-DG protein